MSGAPTRRERTAAWLLLTALATWLGWLKQPAHLDDTFIPVRYARNLLAGEGWVFNPGEFVNGSTSTLNTLVITGLGWLTGERWILAQVVAFGLALGALAFCCWLLFRRDGSVAAWIGAACALTTPYVYWTVGLETALLLALAAGTVLAYVSGRLKLCALLAGFTFLARADGILLLPLLAAHFAWVHRADPARVVRTLVVSGGIALLPVLPWLVYSQMTFGTIFPATMHAKLAQTESGLLDSPVAKWDFRVGSIHYLNGFLDVRAPRWFVRGFYVPTCLIGLLGLAGVCVAFVGRRPALLLILWGVVQYVAYGFLNPPGSVWYYVPSNLALCVAIAALCATLWKTRAAFLRVPARAGAVTAALALLLPTFPDPVSKPVRFGSLHYGAALYDHYREACAWVLDNVPANESLACLEIGVIGYELPEHRIVDMLGLVHARGADAVARRDFTWWIDGQKPDWVLLGRPPWQGAEKLIVADPRFHERYELTRPAKRTHLFKRK